jgi:hypothetical protein
MNKQPGDETVEHHEKADVKIPDITDGDEDAEAPEIRGLDLDEISPRYWYSFRFVGSATSIVLLAICLYVGFSLPVGLGQFTTVICHHHER